MKRFTFFISIFSVGLVLFLFFTNQFGRLFDSGAGNEPKPAWIEEAQRAGEKNRVTFRKRDRANGRLQFIVQGDLDDQGSGTGFDMANLQQSQALRNAEIQFPVYRSGGQTEDALTAMTEMILRAGKIEYDDGSKLKLSDGITGEGDDGSRFETSALDIRYDKKSQKARLLGTKPVHISFPAVQIFGRSGFTGMIDQSKNKDDDGSENATGASGIGELKIMPPVVVVLDRSKGGSFLAFGKDKDAGSAAEPDASDPPSSLDQQVFLVGDGPLTIDRVNNQAIFHDRVRIFEAPKTATIENPPPPGDTWFSCEELQLAFDPSTLQFIGATALRGERPIAVHLPDGNMITAGRMQWLEGSGEALLDEGVNGSGTMLTFQADNARLLTLERRCHLKGNVTAEFQRSSSDATGADPQQQDSRSLSRWQMTGTDHAELTWLDHSRNKSERGRLQEFRAAAAVAHGLKITELREHGAELAGTTLIYDGASDTLEMIGTDRAPSLRPSFKEGVGGRNKIEAGRIALALTSPELTFKDAVNFTIHDVPGQPVPGQAEDIPSWMRDHHAHGKCQELRLTWDQNRELQEVVAVASKERLRGSPQDRMWFELVGSRRAKLGGANLSWTAGEQQIRLTGEPAYVDYHEGAVVLSGQEIRFDVALQTLDATDAQQVRLEAQTALLERAPLTAIGEPSPRPSTPDRPVVILSPNLHVQLAQSQSDDSAASNTNSKSDDPLQTVKFARAWDSSGGFVEISDGVLVAMGREVEWNAEQHLLKLKGEGRQRILHLEGENDDELSAKSIVVQTDRRQIVLEGEVRGRLHQQPPTGSRDAAARVDVPWNVSASGLTATLSEVVTNGKTELVLDNVDARGRIRLTSPDQSVSFEGSACQWSRSNQTMIVKDPDDELALQTLRYGTPDGGQSDVRAREIRVTRNPGERNSIETLWVFLTGDVVGNFHTGTATSSARNGANAAPAKPRTLRLLAENLLAELRPAPGTPGSESKQPLQLHTVSVWNGVNFLSGDMCVLADRAVYTKPTESLVFSAAGDNRVQLIEKNVASKSFERLTLTQRQDGGYSVKARGSDNLRGAEILKILEILKQREKAPKSR